MKRRLFLGLMALAPLAFAQPNDYPTRPIKMIVPFTAGSSSDTVGRFIAQQLSSALGQTVFVENQPGAEGRIGLMAVKNAPGDGYTVLLATWSNLSVNPVLVKDLPYDALKDFKPVAGATRSMLGIVVPANSKLKTLADLVATAKKEPKAVNFGTFAAGYRLATEWFSNLAGVRFTNVPYKSTSQMNTDLMGNQIDVAMDGMTSLTTLLKAGRLRVLAVTGETRHPEFPEVPTIKESGFPEFAIYGWSALYVRSETPDDVTARLVEAMSKVLASQPSKDFAKKIGSEMMTGSPAAMKTFQENEIATFRRVAEAAGLTAQ
jgi:tripartite-type tricarboxylate transporter receptor subunit TctC